MPRQVGGVDLEAIAAQRLELTSGQREAVKRANKASGSVDPDGEFGERLISPDPRPELRPSSPCRS